MSREYKLYVEFTCDVEGCYRRFKRSGVSPDATNILAPSLTTAARDEGWYIPKSGSVYCPDHPEYKELVAEVERLRRLLGSRGSL